MANDWAIMDDNGIIEDGSQEEILAIWSDEKYKYPDDLKGDLILIKICGRRR